MKNYWCIKPIHIQPIQFHFRLDTDRDGVEDRHDCMPFNSKYQHISKTTKQRLQESPLRVTDKPIKLKVKKEEFSIEYPDSYPIMSKEAKQKAPIARQEMLSAIKKYPGILGEMERQQPKEIVYTSFPAKEKEPFGAYIGEKEIFIKMIPPTSIEESPKILHPQIQRMNLAGSIFHESKHLEQDIKGTLPEKIPKRYKENPSESPWEKEAYEYQLKKLEEYPYGKPQEKPISKSLSKILKLDEENE